MHISHESRDVNAISHNGKRFEPDEFGRFEVPSDLAEKLLGTPGWSIPERLRIEVKAIEDIEAKDAAEKPLTPRKRTPRTPKAE